MSTELRGGAPTAAAPAPYTGADFRCVIVTAEWNAHITHKLRDAARETLAGVGVAADHIIDLSVPGAIELTFAAQSAIRALQPDAVIVIGCVIRGDTPHFDYVCRSVTDGVTRLNSSGDTPVVFGLLTVDNEEQALARAGGSLGNKGTEWGAAAIEMANLAARLRDGQIAR